MEGRSQQDRAAVAEAVTNGHTAGDERLAALVAASAVARRQRIATVCFGILAPVGLTIWWATDWLVGRDEPDRSGGITVLVNGYAVVGTLSILIWLLVWRPLVRAEKVNLVAGGAGEPRVTRVASDWLHAWAWSFLILSILGVVLDSLGLSLGPVGIVLATALVWVIKAALGRRD